VRERESGSQAGGPKRDSNRKKDAHNEKHNAGNR